MQFRTKKGIKTTQNHEICNITCSKHYLRRISQPIIEENAKSWVWRRCPIHTIHLNTPQVICRWMPSISLLDSTNKSPSSSLKQIITFVRCNDFRIIWCAEWLHNICRQSPRNINDSQFRAQLKWCTNNSIRKRILYVRERSIFINLQKRPIELH